MGALAADRKTSGMWHKKEKGEKNNKDGGDLLALIVKANINFIWDFMG